MGVYTMSISDIFKSNIFLIFLPSYKRFAKEKRLGKINKHMKRYKSLLFSGKSNRLEYPFAFSYHPDSVLRTPSLFDKLTRIFERFTQDNEQNNSGDLSRFYSLVLNLEQLKKEGIQGDFAELGVYRGNTSAVLADYAGEMGRKLFLLDTFEGFHPDDIQKDSDRGVFSDTDIQSVKQLVQHADICTYLIGRFPDSATDELASARFCFVSLDCDLYKPMKAGLEFFYPRMEEGGYMFIHDYSSPHWQDECTKAVDEFCEEKNIKVVLLPDKSGSAVLRR